MPRQYPLRLASAFIHYFTHSIQLDISLFVCRFFSQLAARRHTAPVIPGPMADLNP